MPPAWKQSFKATLYGNNKWVYPGGIRPRAGSQELDPEFKIMVDKVYTFSHSELDDDVEKMMAKSRPSGGDMDENMKKDLFTGALYYQGKAIESIHSQDIG